jgi:hypothetical protein
VPMIMRHLSPKLLASGRRTEITWLCQSETRSWLVGAIDLRQNPQLVRHGERPSQWVLSCRFVLSSVSVSSLDRCPSHHGIDRGADPSNHESVGSVPLELGLARLAGVPALPVQTKRLRLGDSCRGSHAEQHRPPAVAG